MYSHVLSCTIMYFHGTHTKIDALCALTPSPTSSGKTTRICVFRGTHTQIYALKYMRVHEYMGVHGSKWILNSRFFRKGGGSVCEVSRVFYRVHYVTVLAHDKDDDSVTENIEHEENFLEKLKGELWMFDYYFNYFNLIFFPFRSLIIKYQVIDLDRITMKMKMMAMLLISMKLILTHIQQYLKKVMNFKYFLKVYNVNN
jgi:hypothetical protein